jgi:hypothetical protein
MRTKRGTKKPTKSKSKLSAVAHKASRRTPARGRLSKSTRDVGSIGQAAAKVAKSGARLVGHAGQRVVMAATDSARVAIASAAVELAASLLRDGSRRKNTSRKRRS